VHGEQGVRAIFPAQVKTAVLIWILLRCKASLTVSQMVWEDECLWSAGV
jgi:hypothetical protein